MENELNDLGNIPVTEKQLAALYPNEEMPSQKIDSLVRDGRIIRLKRGLYVASANETGKALSKELIANHLYGSSYVSMYSALKFYGLIPQTVDVVQSMTTKMPKVFENELGKFSYRKIRSAAFNIGVNTYQGDGYSFSIATPEKAVCDLVASSPGVAFRYYNDLECLLEDDLQFDMDALFRFDVNILSEYASVGKKPESIQTLIKYVKRGPFVDYYY